MSNRDGDRRFRDYLGDWKPPDIVTWQWMLCELEYLGRMRHHPPEVSVKIVNWYKS